MDKNRVNNTKNLSEKNVNKKTNKNNTIKKTNKTSADKNNRKTAINNTRSRNINNNGKRNASLKNKTYKKKVLHSNQENSNSDIKIIPLGGLEQIGINITAVEYEDDIIVIDCGLGFPDDDMLGIDLVIPDVNYLEKNIDKVKAFVITHGHEDHIGALPYILKKINVPVYATKLTMGLIEKKLEENDSVKNFKKNIVSYGDKIKLGNFDVEFIKTNHSIQDACALAITTHTGTIIHTGDFKVDYTPVYGDAINLQRFAELGKKGVLALLSDSTNANRPGFTKSEKNVGKAIDEIFAEHKEKRLIIATFASNVDRVQQIINSAIKYKRKVIVEGRSMNSIIDIASKLGYIKIRKTTIVEDYNINKYRDDQLCIISTGSQGESMAALSRITNGTHKYIKISNNDTIVFSSNPIPGNEKAVYNIINDLIKLGAKVIFEDVHVSGHACEEDLKLIYTLTKPKFAIPIHGEYRQLIANGNIAKELGVEDKNVIIAQNGDVISLTQKKAEIIDRVHTGTILVDGLGIGDVGNIVMKDRQLLANDGVIVVVITIDSDKKQIIAGPDIISRGFVYVRESEGLIDEARYVVKKAVNSVIEMNNNTEWGPIKTVIKDTLSDFLWKKTKRKPVILPALSEIKNE